MGAISVSVSRVYPPLAWGAANVFELPDPFAADLPPTYAAHGGAQHFLKIFYADGSAPEFALIAQPDDLETPNRGRGTQNAGGADVRALEWGNYVATFSVNLALARLPTRVELYLAATRYPNIVEGDDHTLLHARDLEAVDAASLPPLLRFGGKLGRLGAQAGVQLGSTSLCDEVRVRLRVRVTLTLTSWLP